MTLATTRARLLTAISGTTDVGNVHSRIRDDLDRPDAEAAYIASGAVNSWEVSDTPRREHGGASAMDRTVLDVTVTAHYKADDANDSHGAFVTLLDAVMVRLMDPTVGFPQITEEGIQIVEAPDRPVRLRTGHSALRCVFRFTLWDVAST